MALNLEFHDKSMYVPGDHQKRSRLLSSLAANQSGEITKLATVPLTPGGGLRGADLPFLPSAPPPFPCAVSPRVAAAPAASGGAGGGKGNIFLLSRLLH